MRGTLYGESDIEEPRRLGYDAIYWDELEQLTPEAYGDRVRARVGDRPAFLSFDIDFVDPAFAPATGTPEVGGPSSGQALAYLRALTGHRLPRLRLRRGGAGLRPAGQHHRLGGGQRLLRDAVAAGRVTAGRLAAGSLQAHHPDQLPHRLGRAVQLRLLVVGQRRA